MLGPVFQSIISLAALGIAFLAYEREQYMVAGALFAVALLGFVGVLRYGGVPAARRHFRAGRRETAWNILERTPFGGRALPKSWRCYFHLIRSACLLDQERWSDVMSEGRALLDIPGVNAINVSTAHAAMAKASLELGDRDAARIHLQESASRPHKPGLDALLREVRDGLDSPADAA